MWAMMVALVAAPGVGAQTLVSNAIDGRGIPAGGPYVPPGGLFDNEQSDGTTSLASQDSTGNQTARSADDFALPAQTCASNQFQITQIRAQMVQADAAPQAFAIDIFNDDGTGTSPTPTGAITPIFTVPQSGATALGAFGVGTSIFEVSFAPTNMVLTGGTTYWISGYGTDGAANSAAFNNFFAASAGATGSTDNGVIIAPNAGVTSWTPVQNVIGGNPLAFSFAIDGVCRGIQTPVPANQPWAIASLIGLLSLLGVVVLRRRLG